MESTAIVAGTDNSNSAAQPNTEYVVLSSNETANADVESPCKAGKSLSALAPPWHSNGNLDVSAANNEEIVGGMSSIQIDRPVISECKIAPRKQRGLYTSMTPSTSREDNGHDVESGQHGDEASGPQICRSSTHIDQLEIKVPLDSTIWKRISSRNLRKPDNSRQVSFLCRYKYSAYDDFQSIIYFTL